jgi:hypothetical protein
VKFDINYTVSGPDITLSQSFVNVDDIKKESKLIEVTWEDGQKLDIYVKATDLIGENTIDTKRYLLHYGNKTYEYVFILLL